MTREEMFEKLNGVLYALMAPVEARGLQSARSLTNDVLAALSSVPPDLVALRLVLKCAERACDGDNIDAAADYVREAIRHVDKLTPAPPVAETPMVYKCIACPFQGRVSDATDDTWTCPRCGRYYEMSPPASPVVAPAPVVENRGEVPPSSTWGDLGPAARCSRCGDDGRPCSHCETAPGGGR